MEYKMPVCVNIVFPCGNIYSVFDKTSMCLLFLNFRPRLKISDNCSYLFKFIAIEILSQRYRRGGHLIHKHN